MNNKLIIFLLILIISLISVSANSTLMSSDEGVIILTLENRPPSITSIEFSSEIVYPDTELDCFVNLNDEKPGEVDLTYNWYINNELIDITSAEFKKDDIIKCVVIPIDNENLKGIEKSISIKVKNKPILTIITGFVVKNLDSSHNISQVYTFVLLLLIIILSRINFILFKKYFVA